jgi:hypothetical protein
MIEMNLYLGIVSCVLLALVAGLLMTVGLWLYEFRQNYKKAPLLGEELTRQLMSAREALVNLQRVAKESGPELAKAVSAAQNMTQDLTFLIARAEKVASKLDDTTAAKPKEAKVPSAESGKVVSENVVAAASTARDPLEELLAGLGTEPSTEPAPPPPQPELNLTPPPAAEVKLRRTLAG